ncbi:hypothetical protein K0U83_08550, partial [bacterium]|nr:hypothetical protein [bacterium]
AVTDPNADSALPERIIANFQALPPGVRGDRNQLRNYLLNNPDAGEFLRDVTNHINRRVPPAFAATVTDPEAVDPDALLVQALGVPVPLGHNIVAPDPAAFQHEMIPAVPPEAAPVMPRDQQLELIARAADAADARDRGRFIDEVTTKDPRRLARQQPGRLRWEQHRAAGYPMEGTPLEQQDYIRQYYAGGGTLPGDEGHVEAAPVGSAAAAAQEEEEEEP